jgi:digeranylgeranylglycerophospholipid reductase
VIGADGARSTVRKAMRVQEPSFLLNGLTANISGIDMGQDIARVFFGRETAPNFFAWMIPVGEITRVGLCLRGTERTVHEHFKALFSNKILSGMLDGGKVLSVDSGLIPLGPLPKTHADSSMLVGDAAGQVKATSGGGIYPGLVCAQHCATSAVKGLEKEDLSRTELASYDAAWRSEIGDELEKAMMMHRIFSSLDDAQLDDVFRMLSNPDILETINRVGDIDFPSKLGWLLLKNEPGFLKYTGKFLKHGIMNL